MRIFRPHLQPGTDLLPRRTATFRCTRSRPGAHGRSPMLRRGGVRSHLCARAAAQAPTALAPVPLLCVTASARIVAHPTLARPQVLQFTVVPPLFAAMIGPQALVAPRPPPQFPGPAAPSLFGRRPSLAVQPVLVRVPAISARGDLPRPRPRKASSPLAGGPAQALLVPTQGTLAAQASW